MNLITGITHYIAVIRSLDKLIRLNHFLKLTVYQFHLILKLLILIELTIKFLSAVQYLIL